MEEAARDLTPSPDGGCWDAHVHVFRADAPVQAGHYRPGHFPLERIEAEAAACGVRHLVLVQPSVYGTDNRCLLDALDRLDGAGRGVAVPPEDAMPVELRRMHARGVRGVRGVRLNLESSGSQDVAVLAAMLARWSGRIADLGWHVQLYAASDVIAALADRLAALPTRVVLDHFALIAHALGAKGPGAAIKDMLRTGRVLVKLSAPYRLPTPALAAAWARAFVETSPTSVLWGSGWPHTTRQPEAGRLGVSAYRRIAHGDFADAVQAWLPSPDLRRLVLFDTPADLYGF